MRQNHYQLLKILKFFYFLVFIFWSNHSEAAPVNVIYLVFFKYPNRPLWISVPPSFLVFYGTKTIFLKKNFSFVSIPKNWLKKRKKNLKKERKIKTQPKSKLLPIFKQKSDQKTIVFPTKVSIRNCGNLLIILKIHFSNKNHFW